VDFAKNNWLFAPFIALLLMGIGMAAKPWFTAKMSTKDSTGTVAKPGDKLPEFLRGFLKISGFLAPVGILLGSDYAFAAAQCCAERIQDVGLQAGAGVMHQVWGLLLTLLGTSVAFGIAHLSAPDVLDAKSENNGESITYTPGSAQAVSMFMRTGTKHTSASGKPLVAVDTTIALDTTVEVDHEGGADVVDQDLARLLDYVQISSPFHGVILDKVTGTGPVLDLVINYIGQGFCRSGDAPLETITLPLASTKDVVITKYFTFPWAQRILMDPAMTTPWLGSLNNAEIKCGIAASTALAAVSTSARTKSASTLRVSTSYALSPIWRQAYLPYWRLDTPASGSDGLSFENFGGAGPACTKAVDIVHTIGQLSNLAGLPGNTTFEKVTRIVAPSFGLDDVANIDMLVKARLAAQFYGRIGDYDYANDGNHRQGTLNAGLALDKLLFLLLRQPSLEMHPRTMMVFDKDTRLPLRQTYSTPRTGADAFIIGGMRELSQASMVKQSAMSGGLMPASMTQGRHARTKQIISLE
jgi:hypothetical protein